MLKMKFLILFVTTCFLYFGQNVHAVGKVSCFYNSQASKRKDLAKVTPEELKPALSLCTHLVYGFIGIDDEDYKVKSLDKELDTEKGKNLFRAVTDLKRINPALKILVSVGGFQEKDKDAKYLSVLEKTDRRGKLVTSLTKLVKDYGFDGADLAWQFPMVKEKKEKSTLGSIWSSIKHTVVGTSKDEHEKEHKEQFTALVRELGAALRGNNHILTLSVMPHVHHQAYYDGPNIKDSVEQIHLMTYDYRTPWRTPEQADYSAPTQYVGSRIPEQNIEATVKWWLEQKVPATKLLIAIPTFGRTWKLNSDSGKVGTGTSPVKADGPGKPGPYLAEEGTMAYYEICPTLTTNPLDTSSILLKKIPDPTNRLGTYAVRQDDRKKGVWVSYEDPDTAAKKAYYAKLKGLGGVAIVDLSLDDFKGSCDGTHRAFPILYNARANL